MAQGSEDLMIVPDSEVGMDEDSADEEEESEGPIKVFDLRHFAFSAS